MKRCVAKDDRFLLRGTGNLIRGRCEAADQTQTALQSDNKQSLSCVLIHGYNLPLHELVLAFLGDLHDLDGHRGRAGHCGRARHHDRRDGDGSTRHGEAIDATGRPRVNCVRLANRRSLEPFAPTSDAT